MVDTAGIDRRVSEVQHGFNEMKQEALKIVDEHPVAERLDVAMRLYRSEKHQSRMVAVFILGYSAALSGTALKFLRTRVSKDDSWQVQEILAQAFNEYCKATGYEKALPTIKDWLGDWNPNVRRAVTEGLRIWNQRDYFRVHPEVAVRLLSALRADESEYVRKSVGNALRDISRKEKDLIRKELATWDASDPRTKLTLSLAGKFL